MPLSRYLDSALRHTYKLLEGMDDEDHAAMGMWNLASFIHTKHMIEKGLLPKKLDDMPNHFKAKNMEAYQAILKILNEALSKDA